MPQVRRSIHIKAPNSKVWRWLATQEGLSHWISANIKIDLRLGGAYRFLGPDGRTWVSGSVLEFEAERSLILSWLEEGQGWLRPARLVIRLTPVGDETEVILIHDGFEGTGPDWMKTVDGYEQGADIHRILERLADLVNSSNG
jgi:uncharacterized protein YndB with AHSA1/START domain